MPGAGAGSGRAGGPLPRTVPAATARPSCSSRRSTRAERPLAFDLATPTCEEVEFGAIRLGAALCRIRGGRRGCPRIPSSIRSRASRQSPSLQGAEAQGPRPHHRDVGAILVELHPVAEVRGVPDDEGEEAQVARGVAGDEVVTLQVEERGIAVEVLDALAHQLAEGRARRGRSRRPGLGGLGLEVVQGRLAAVGADAVGAAFELHLEEAEVEPPLQLLAAVVADDRGGPACLRGRSPNRPGSGRCPCSTNGSPVNSSARRRPVGRSGDLRVVHVSLGRPGGRGQWETPRDSSPGKAGRVARRLVRSGSGARSCQIKARCRRGSSARVPWCCARRPGRWCAPRRRRGWRRRRG